MVVFHISAETKLSRIYGFPESLKKAACMRLCPNALPFWTEPHSFDGHRWYFIISFHFCLFQSYNYLRWHGSLRLKLHVSSTVERSVSPTYIFARSILILCYYFPFWILFFNHYVLLSVFFDGAKRDLKLFSYSIFDLPRIGFDSSIQIF